MTSFHALTAPTLPLPRGGSPLFTAPTAPTAPTRPACLLRWENLVQRGRQALQNQRPDLALFSFHQALAIAQDLLQTLQHTHPGTEQADDAIAALVVSHLQLSDLCADAQLLEPAASHLCRAHATLRVLQQGQHGPALQQAAWRHSRETLAALLHFLNQWGPHPAITQLLQPASDNTVH